MKKRHSRFSKFKKELRDKEIPFEGFNHRRHRKTGRNKKISEIKMLKEDDRVRDLDNELKNIL